MVNQSTEEWLAEYSSGSSYSDEKERRLIRGLVFDHHRTTKDGSVVLSFNWGDEEVVAFFNCDVYRQRGPLKGSKYKTGRGGQFLPPERGKFRKFWQACIGKPPRRWAAVHKELKPRLKELRFQAEMVEASKSDGEAYYKLTDLSRWDRGY